MHLKEGSQRFEMGLYVSERSSVPISFRNTPSTAGNSMTGSGRPSPEPLLKKRSVPSRTGGGENSGNALEASNALNYRVWGIPAVLSTGIPGNALRAFPGSFRNSSGISSGKSQPYWGYGPLVVNRRCLAASNHWLFLGESNRDLTPILLKCIAIHLPFLLRYFLHK